MPREEKERRYREHLRASESEQFCVQYLHRLKPKQTLSRFLSQNFISFSLLLVLINQFIHIYFFSVLVVYSFLLFSCAIFVFIILILQYRRATKQ